MTGIKKSDTFPGKAPRDVSDAFASMLQDSLAAKKVMKCEYFVTKCVDKANEVW